MSTQEKNLRNALKGNALFSLISGMTLIIFHGKVGQAMNISQTQVLQIIGVGLLLFVTLLMYNVFRKKLDIRHVKFIIIQDWTWVIGSAILLIFDPFHISTLGNICIAGVALIVMFLAVIQAKALLNLLAFKNRKG